MRGLPAAPAGRSALVVISAFVALGGCGGGDGATERTEVVAVQADAEDPGSEPLRESITQDEYGKLGVAMSNILKDFGIDHFIALPSPQVPELRLWVEDGTPVNEADVRALLTREAVGEIEPVAFEVGPDWDEVFSVDIVDLGREEDDGGGLPP